MGGITLRLDREKWGYSIFADTSEGALARFFGEDIEVDSPRYTDGQRNLRSRNDVLYVRAVATSGALHGVKAAFGSRQKSTPRMQDSVRYFIAV